MTQAISCPDAPSLRRLLLGQTGEEESAPLEDHLLRCDACLRALQALPADDPLVSALRQGHGADTPAPRGDLVEKLRLRLREMSPAAREADTLGGGNTADSAPPSDPTLDAGPSLAPAQAADEIGRLGNYRVLKELGRGGMGVVYQAEDVKLRRTVALKAMLPHLAADPASRQRFLREAQAMAAVHHDHVVAIFQVDEDRGVPFLAMEFLKGMPLDRWLKEGRKPTVPQTLRIGREIADGLAAAHETGLIHRDIKPGNIWLDSSHQGRVKILDFGLARAATEDVHLTRSGAVVGTPAYMAPEQGRGEKVDGRSDLFSLGVVLYRLCTGAMPFAGDTTMALLMSLALDHPRPPAELNRGIPLKLSELVMNLLEKDPARRPQSAREVVRAIQALEQELKRPPADNEPTEALATPPAPARRRRRPLALAVAAAAFLALAAVAAVVVIRYKDRDGKPQEIKIEAPAGATDLTATVSPAAPESPSQAGLGHEFIGTWQLDHPEEGEPFRETWEVKEKAGALSVEGSYRRDGRQFAFFRGKDVRVADGKLRFIVTYVVSGGFADGVRITAAAHGDRLVFDWEAPSVGTSGSHEMIRVRPDGGPTVAPLDDAWVKQVQALPAEKQVDAVMEELKKRNPGFDGKAEPTIEGGAVTGLRVVTDSVTDISPVRALTGLKMLSLSSSAIGKGRLADLSPLKGMKLARLHVGDNPVSDLTPLMGMGLVYLHCWHTRVSDLKPLAGAPLRDLDIANAAVTDLSPLAGMPLERVHCDFVPARDSDLLRSIKTLKTINGLPADEFWKTAATK